MKTRQMKPLTAVGSLIFMLALVLLVPHPAYAHSRTEFGPYTVIIGWENEPPIVGERNGILLEFTQNDEPVEGLEGVLSASVLYEDQVFGGNLQPTEKAGVYRVTVFPTVRGHYKVQLQGTIDGTAVDATLEPELVLPAKVLEFPEASPDPFQMEQTIADLTAQIQTLRIVAVAGVISGLLGLGLSAVLFARSRKR